MHNFYNESQLRIVGLTDLVKATGNGFILCFI